MDDVAELHLPVHERIKRIIARLPILTKEDVPLDDSCPICLNPFDAILEGKLHDEGAFAGEASEAADSELGGITKLEGCGHFFCRADLIEWIQGRHGSCPACRNVFSSIKPPSDSDNESSDGDYIPGDDEDEDEDDAFLDTDGFTEYEFDADEMELDAEFDTDVDEDEDAVVDMSVYLDFDASADIAAWDNAREGVDEGMANWGLSDGEGSESLSEGDVLNLSAVLENEPVQTDDAAVFDDDSVEEASVSVLEDDTAESK